MYVLMLILFKTEYKCAEKYMTHGLHAQQTYHTVSRKINTKTMKCALLLHIATLAILVIVPLTRGERCGTAKFSVKSSKGSRGCKLKVSVKVSLGRVFKEPLYAVHVGGRMVNAGSLRFSDITTPGKRRKVNGKKKKFQDFWILPATSGQNQMHFPCIRASSISNRGMFCYGDLKTVFFEIDNNCNSGRNTYTTSLETKVGDDVAFVIDTTGSMTEYIESVKESASQIIDLVATSTNNRIGIVQYQDPFVNVIQDFTNSKSVIKKAINRISVCCGGDKAENVFSGLKAAFDMSWRPGASRSVLLMGDAPAKDPEIQTGLTKALILSYANSINVVGDTTPSVRYGTNGSLSVLSEHQQRNTVINIGGVEGMNPLFMIAAGDSGETVSNFKTLADGTRGQTYQAKSSKTAVAKIRDALKDAMDKQEETPETPTPPTPPPTPTPSSKAAYSQCTGSVTPPTVSVICFRSASWKRRFEVHNSNDCLLGFQWTDNLSRHTGVRIIPPGTTSIAIISQGSTVWFTIRWLEPVSGLWKHDSHISSTCDKIY